MKPIIFSADMVKAILDGRKTQARMVIELPIRYGDVSLKEVPTDQEGIVGIIASCPYGQVGDRLWVRETWAGGITKSPDSVDYKADGYDYGSDPFPWKPSTHMPRWASRITLEIVDVRVERVQEITGSDCEGEGISTGYRVEWDAQFDLHRKFIRLWDSINAKRGYGWESNCWVWVLTFKVV